MNLDRMNKGLLWVIEVLSQFVSGDSKTAVIGST